MAATTADRPRLDRPGSVQTQDGLVENLNKAATLSYARREEQLGPELMRQLERLVFLQVIDKHWRDHLYELDRLREGIGLRAYGQKNPLMEYKSEAFDMFMNTVESIQEEALALMFRAQVSAPPEPGRQPRAARAHHPDARQASQDSIESRREILIAIKEGFAARETVPNETAEAQETDGKVEEAPEAATDGQQQSEETQEEPEVTDAAKRRAKELGVDPTEVKGSGSGGRVLVKDVEAAAE